VGAHRATVAQGGKCFGRNMKRRSLNIFMLNYAQTAECDAAVPRITSSRGAVANISFWGAYLGVSQTPRAAAAGLI
jgi:hypothetical protein